MKFITEDTLRWQYRQEPFTSFHVQKDTRLTPEAYQFLVDRRIVVYYEDPKFQRVQGNNKIQAAGAGKVSTSESVAVPAIGSSLEWALAYLFVAQTMAATMCNRSFSKALGSIAEQLGAVKKAALEQTDISLALLEGIPEGSADTDFSIHHISVEAPYAVAAGQLNLVRVSCIDLVEQLSTASGSSIAMNYKKVIEACIVQLEQLIKSLAGE